MSQDQLLALLGRLQADGELRGKLIAATGFDQAEQIAVQAGFVVTQADWLAFQGQEPHPLSDAELEVVSGGILNKGPAPSIYGKTIEIKAEELQIVC